MIKLYIILFILNVSLERHYACLNETERRIILSLMDELEIGHCILITENATNNQLTNFKDFATRKKMLNYQTLDFLTNLKDEKNYPDQKTIIVLKVEKLSTVVEFFKTLWEVLSRLQRFN